MYFSNEDSVSSVKSENERISNELSTLKDTLFSPIDIDYNNLSDVTTEENKYYGISFKELDGFYVLKL